MSGLNRKERKARLVRVLAVVLAVLLVGSILASVLPVFSAFAEGEARSSYELTLDVNTAAQAVNGVERLDYVNTSGRSLDCVFFTLYPNLFRRQEALPVADGHWNDAFPAGYLPGGVVFSGVRVNGEKANWSVSGTYEQFLRVPCDLGAGERAVFEFEFVLLLSENCFSSGFGKQGWRLVSFYPAAAVYDGYTEDFVLNGWTQVTDPMMGDEADYTVRVLTDDGWMLASTGISESRKTENGRILWTISAERARDFSLTMGKNVKTSTRMLESGLEITAYAETDALAKSMADCAAEVLAQYEEWFGECPQRQIDLAETDLLRGMSRPGMLLLPTALTARSKSDEMKAEIARLCAGQWFGCGVGCNPESEPWMNDTLTAYAAMLYFEEKEGHDGYLKRLNAAVLDALQITIPGGLTVDSDASVFTSRGEYELVVIDRGMAVMHEMRSLMGREAFIEGLRRYAEDNTGKIASVEQFARAFNDVTGSRWDEYIVGEMHTISDYVNVRLEWFE